jgi:hypothetical protein
VRAFAIWLLGFGVAMATVVGITTSTRSTEQVFVLVDSSFAMDEVWGDVRLELDRLDDQRYAEFALATEKELVHSWRDELDLGDTTAFAPCDFDDATAYQQVGDAEELILVTTSGSCAQAAVGSEWEVIVLDP